MVIPFLYTLYIYKTHLQSFLFVSLDTFPMKLAKQFISSIKLLKNVSKKRSLNVYKIKLPCWPPPQPYHGHASHEHREYGQQSEHNGASCKHW